MKRLLSAHRKKVLYVVVGGWNTAFGYGAFAALYSLCTRLGWHYLVALTAAQVLSILNAYVGYKRIVFRTRGRWFQELLRFSAVYWAVFIANAAVLPVLVGGLKMSPLVAQAGFTAVTVVASYVAHSRFSFASATVAGAVP